MHCKDTILRTQNNWPYSKLIPNSGINWYEKALRGTYAALLGNKLLYCLAKEIAEEFPSVDKTPDIIRDRHYEEVECEGIWCK